MTAPMPSISAVVFHHGVCGYLHFSDLSLDGGDGTMFAMTGGCSWRPSPLFLVLSFGVMGFANFLNGAASFESKEGSESQKEIAISGRRRSQGRGPTVLFLLSCF